MTIANNADDGVVLVLADGIERHLRYSLSAVKRIKQQFGNTAEEMLQKTPIEDFLPKVLMEGIVEKEGLTEQVLCDDLITGPMTDECFIVFVQAFFGKRPAENLREFEELRQADLRNRRKIAAAKILEVAAKTADSTTTVQ